MLLTVPQSEAHPYGTPPDSGLVRSPRARFPGTAYVLLPVLTARVLFTARSWLSGTPGPQACPGARSEGCFRLRFLLMELMELIWDSVLGFYF